MRSRGASDTAAEQSSQCSQGRRKTRPRRGREPRNGWHRPCCFAEREREMRQIPVLYCALGCQCNLAGVRTATPTTAHRHKSHHGVTTASSSSSIYHPHHPSIPNPSPSLTDDLASNCANCCSAPARLPPCFFCTSPTQFAMQW